MRHVITNIIQHGAAVKEFHIRREDQALFPAWLPGSHIALKFSAADGSAFENHYSLIGVAGPATTLRIAVQREENGKGGFRCLHDEIAIGRMVELSGPFNSFPLHISTASSAPSASTAATSAAGARTILIGGGIGITPMISMAHALAAQEVPYQLHYLVSNIERVILEEELRSMSPQALTLHISQESGRADPAALLGDYVAGSAVYACGPVTLLQGLADAAPSAGWPVGAIHVESFGPRVQSDDAPVTVELSLSQMTIEVQPGTSILDALIAADVFVSYDCKRGECGNCYAQVVEGEPIHRDVCLTPAMRTQGMCTCVSWASKEHLVLAL